MPQIIRPTDPFIPTTRIISGSFLRLYERKIAQCDHGYDSQRLAPSAVQYPHRPQDLSLQPCKRPASPPLPSPMHPCTSPHTTSWCCNTCPPGGNVKRQQLYLSAFQPTPSPQQSQLAHKYHSHFPSRTSIVASLVRSRRQPRVTKGPSLLSRCYYFGPLPLSGQCGRHRSLEQVQNECMVHGEYSSEEV